MKTADEILKAIKELSVEEQGKVFAGKNKKLDLKDETISQLKKENEEYRAKELKLNFKNSIDEVLNNSKIKVKEAYRDDILKIAGVNEADQKKDIEKKINDTLKNDKYKFALDIDNNSVNSIVNTQENNNTNNNTNNNNENIKIYT